MNLVLPALNVPLLIVGLGLLLAAALLPWLSGGALTDRRGRVGLALAGLVAGGLAWALAPPDESRPDGAETAPAVSAVSAPADWTEAACVEQLARRMAALTSGAAAASAVPLPEQAPGASGIGLVSGSQTGTYHAIADDLVVRARQRGVPLFNRETQGSVENVRLLADPQENAALGFAQSDVLAWLRRADDPAERQWAAALRLVMPLYAEEVHVLARREVGTLAALAGRRVVTAASSRGSRHTAETLLRGRGIMPAALDTSATAAEGLCRVLAGTADAMVIVAGKPVAQLVSLDALRELPGQPLAQVHLLPIDDRPGEDGYEAAQLGPADYAWLDRPVATLAARFVVEGVGFSAQGSGDQKLGWQQLGRLGQLLREELPALRQPPHHPKWRDVDPHRPVRGWRPDACARV